MQLCLGIKQNNGIYMLGKLFTYLHIFEYFINYFISDDKLHYDINVL